jgi:drug/metabolite transporter (DMT)-like permease
MWPLLAGGTALFFALNGAWSARVSRRIGALLGAWTLFAFALPLVAAYLLFRGLPNVTPRFWPVWGANAVGNLGAWYLFFSALRTGDLGITYPLLALTPVFVVPVEWILLRELPTPVGVLGIGVLVAGVYLLNVQTAREGLLAPMAALAKDASAMKALAVALLWSVAGTLDRVAVLESSPAFYGVMLCAGQAALFLPFAIFADRGAADRGARRGIRERLSPCGTGTLVVHGLFFACMLVMQMEALTLQRASYVLSIKRAGSVVAVLIGHLAFREEGLGPRLVGTLVTLAGASILVFFG